MAYVEPVAVGDALPSLPIFLDRGTYVPAPLESSYQTTWSKCPAVVKEVVQVRALAIRSRDRGKTRAALSYAAET